MAGILIALEGIDGSGKTTQREHLGAYITSLGYPLLITAEPSDGAIGQLIRATLRGGKPEGSVVPTLNPTSGLSEASLALLFAADRLDHCAREIEPALARDHVVLCDRYLLSSLAYQSIDHPLAWVMAINAQARRPDLSIVLQITANLAACRRRTRGLAPDRYETILRQEALVQTYSTLQTRDDVGPCVGIDAGQDLETVATEVRQVVDRFLRGGSGEI